MRKAMPARCNACRAHNGSPCEGAVHARPRQPPVQRPCGRISCGSAISPTSPRGRAFLCRLRDRRLRPGASLAGASEVRCGPTSCSMHWCRPCTRVSPIGTSWSIISDRGAHYVPIKYSERLSEDGTERSVDSKGDITIMPVSRPSTGFTRVI